MVLRWLGVPATALVLGCGLGAGDAPLLLSLEEVAHSTERLGQVTSLQCVLRDGFVGERRQRGLDFERSKGATAGVAFSIDQIDLRSRRARLLGNSAAVDVAVMQTGSGLTFLEVTPGGSVNVTTVFAVPIDSTAELYDAVHSRHVSAIAAMPMTSQYRGHCAVI